MDTSVLIAVVSAGSAVAGAMIAGGVSVWVARRQGKAQDKTADASIQEQINAGFAALTRQYEARNTDLLQQNQELAGKLDEANRKLDEALERADQLAGEVRDLTQHVESLEEALRKGRPIPARRKRPHPLAQPPLAVIPASEPDNG